MTSSCCHGDDDDKRTPADVLLAAQRRISAQKRAQVKDTVDAMVARGEKITFASVLKASGVSRWLVYQPPLDAYIRAAMLRSADGPDWLDTWDNDDDEQLYE